MMKDNLLLFDFKFNWHPCTQMKDHEIIAPLIIKSAYGSYFELNDGRKLIDATSSWWCKVLGHNHPRLKAKLYEQVNKFEHVIFANTTYSSIVNLSQLLTIFFQGLTKVFYTGDGSSAVEASVKMSLHSRIIEGKSKKCKFIALKNGYHGETIGALSLTEIDLYRKPYKDILFDVEFISDIPYVDSYSDPLWQDCLSEWEKVESNLEKFTDNTTAVIVEPIIQAAGGMKIYSQDFLKRLSIWCKENDVHLNSR